MPKLDGGLNDVLRDHLPKAVHRTRVEQAQGSTNGAGDLELCFRGIDCWLELKKVYGWRIKNMRPLQVSWIERRHMAGGRVYICARRRNATDDEIYFFKPGAARLFVHNHNIRDVPAELVALKFGGGPKLWNWQAIENLLFGP